MYPVEATFTDSAQASAYAVEMNRRLDSEAMRKCGECHMNHLYLISQTENNDYDTYDAAVVCAPDLTTAINMNPRTGLPMTEDDWKNPYTGWCTSADKVAVVCIGEADPGITQGVVLASFNAG